MDAEIDVNKMLTIHYTNYKGESGTRRVIPIAIRFDVEPPWHCQKAWLMDAFDLDKGAVRTFAMGELTIFSAAVGTQVTAP